MPPWAASSERQFRHSMTTVEETEAAGGCPDMAFPREGSHSPNLAHSYTTRPTSLAASEEVFVSCPCQSVAGEARATSPLRSRGLGGKGGISFANTAAMGGGEGGHEEALAGTEAAAEVGGPTAAAYPEPMHSPFSIPEGWPPAEAPQLGGQEEVLRQPSSVPAATNAPSATGAPRLTVQVPSTPKPAAIGLASDRASGFLGGGCVRAVVMPPAGLELFGCQRRVPVLDSPEDLLWLDPDNLHKLRQNIEVRLKTQCRQNTLNEYIGVVPAWTVTHFAV